jgi:non-ribosomal peptide synthetase component F
VLARVKDATTGAYAHQDLPFGKLVQILDVERDASRPPVFQIVLVHAEGKPAPARAAGVEFALTDLITGISAAKFDLTLATQARPEGLWLECSYTTALFDAATIGRLLGHFETLLRGVVADPSARLSQVPVLTPAELYQELHGWNDTGVHEAFAAQVARTPGAVAAEIDGDQVSYAQLSGQASQIARRLRAAGVGPEVLAGVCGRAPPGAQLRPGHDRAPAGRPW